MCDSCRKLTGALRQIEWKLNRKELDQKGNAEWAKIDRNDAVIRDARNALSITRTGQPYQSSLKP